MKEQLEKKADGSWKVRTDTPLARLITTMVHNAWNSTSEYFPGPQPISIERKHFPILKKNTYVVCEKSDGVRHVFIALMYEGVKLCVLVNRAFEIVLAPLSVPKVAYQGTIIDGELISTNSKSPTFLVYDAVMVSGVSVTNQNLIERLVAANTVVSGILKIATDPVTLKMKTFFNLGDMEEFQTKYIPSLEYKVDGIVFTPVNEPIRIGTHETLFKWKPREQNTIDFKAKYVGNKWCLYVQEKGVLIFESDLKSHEVPPWITEDCIVECQYMIHDEPRWWKPINLRKDKVHPNNRRTFYNTLKNIRENIQLSEFL